MRKYKCKYDIEFQDLKEIMDFVADKYGKNIGFIYKSADRKTKTEITYKKFREDLDALGSYLISKGLKGKRIVVIGPNSYQWLVAYYAVVINVGVVVPLDKGLPEEDSPDRYVNIVIILPNTQTVDYTMHQEKTSALLILLTSA